MGRREKLMTRKAPRVILQNPPPGFASSLNEVPHSLTSEECNESKDHEP